MAEENKGTIVQQVLAELEENKTNDNLELKKSLKAYKEFASTWFWADFYRKTLSILFFLFLQVINICLFGLIYSTVELSYEQQICYMQQRKTLGNVYQQFAASAIYEDFNTKYLALGDDHTCVKRYPNQVELEELLGANRFDEQIPNGASFNDLFKIIDKVQSEGKLYFDDNKNVVLGADQCSKNWEYKGALFFMAQSSTAVGYGGGAPATYFGKVIFIIFCVPCVMAGVFFLDAVGAAFKALFDALEKKVNESKFKIGLLVKIFMIAMWFFLLPPVLYLIVKDEGEPWSYWQALYFHMVSTTTIGFGDFVGDYERNKLDSEIGLHASNLLLLYFGMSIFLGYLNDMFTFANAVEVKAASTCLFRCWIITEETVKDKKEKAAHLKEKVRKIVERKRKQQEEDEPEDEQPVDDLWNQRPMQAHRDSLARVL